MKKGLRLCNTMADCQRKKQRERLEKSAREMKRKKVEQMLNEGYSMRKTASIARCQMSFVEEVVYG